MTDDTLKLTEVEKEFLEDRECDTDSDLLMIVVEVARDWGADNPQTVLDEYQGYYSNDADFARQTCEEIYDLNNKGGWHPAFYIDWEWCARDLMMDYHEEQGHYFRST